MGKLRSGSGEARLIVLMALVALVLACVIVVPIVRGASESRLEALDAEYVSTAERMARQELIDGGQATVLVYDSENKRFVPPDEVGAITPYANAAIHEGMYLVVTVAEGGELTTAWMKPDAIAEMTR